MKILLIFGVVIYLNYVASFKVSGFDKGPKLISGSFNKPGKDYALLTKVNRKRYTGFAQKSAMKQTGDLLNTYFKIGSISHSDLTVSPEWSPGPSDVFIDNASAKLRSYQSTPSVSRKAKKVQKEFGDRSLQTPFEQQTPRVFFVIEKTEPIKYLDSEPKLVKRPIIVVGRVRKGAGSRPARTLEEWRDKRKTMIHF